jgi:hypothetical protein
MFRMYEVDSETFEFVYYLHNVRASHGLHCPKVLKYKPTYVVVIACQEEKVCCIRSGATYCYEVLRRASGVCRGRE